MFTGMLFGIVSTALAVEWPGSISFNLYLCLQFLEAELNKALLYSLQLKSVIPASSDHSVIEFPFFSEVKSHCSTVQLYF